MHSPRTPDSDFPGRVLSVALEDVRRRRTQRRVVLLASTASLCLAVLLVTRMPLVPERPSQPGSAAFAATSSPPPAELSPSIIKRVSGGPLPEVNRSQQPSSIERVPYRSGQASTIQRLSDDQFFASLPDEHGAALVEASDGSSKLFVFR